MLVGEPWFSNGQDIEGRVFVFVGSPLGLATTPTWVIEGDQQDAELGLFVGPAGDVNGDGFGDVILHYKTSIGTIRPRLCHGSALGLIPQVTWSTPWFASAAGDVNRDGYGDVLLQNRNYDNGEQDEGAIAVHLGSPLGLLSIPFSLVEGNQEDLHFGASARLAGDVNGDGHSDLIVTSMENAVRVYAGTATGLSLIGEIQQQLSSYYSTGAGDVNGDGYSDLLISGGITDVEIFHYLGGPGPLSPTEAWYTTARFARVQVM